MMLRIQIAKFEFRQYQLKAVSPNLMLAKVTRYTVIFMDGNFCDCQVNHENKRKLASHKNCLPVRKLW